MHDSERGASWPDRELSVASVYADRELVARLFVQGDGVAVDIHSDEVQA